MPANLFQNSRFNAQLGQQEDELTLLQPQIALLMSKLVCVTELVIDLTYSIQRWNLNGISSLQKEIGKLFLKAS